MQHEWQWFGDEELSKGQETKLRIIKTAIKLFGNTGFSRVTLQQIAKVSKTSHPLILKHFGDKENLLFAVRKYVSYQNHRWVDGRIAPTLSGREALLTFCHENIAWAFSHGDEAKILLLTYYYSSLDTSTPESPGVRAMTLGKSRLMGHLQQADREGAYFSDLKIETAAEMIHEYAVGLLTRMMVMDLGRTQKLPTVYKRKLEIFIGQFLK